MPSYKGRSNGRTALADFQEGFREDLLMRGVRGPYTFQRPGFTNHGRPHKLSIPVALVPDSETAPSYPYIAHSLNTGDIYCIDREKAVRVSDADLSNFIPISEHSLTPKQRKTLVEMRRKESRLATK